MLARGGSIRKRDPCFPESMEEISFFPFFTFFLFHSWLRACLSHGIALPPLRWSHLYPKRRLSSGKKELEKGTPVVQRVWGNPLIFLSCFPISFILKAAPVMWNCKKAQEASTPSFWPEELGETSHYEPKCGWNTREKRLEMRIP